MGEVTWAGFGFCFCFFVVWVKERHLLQVVCKVVCMHHLRKCYLLLVLLSLPRLWYVPGTLSRQPSKNKSNVSLQSICFASPRPTKSVHRTQAHPHFASINGLGCLGVAGGGGESAGGPDLASSTAGPLSINQVRPLLCPLLPHAHFHTRTHAYTIRQPKAMRQP